ncbi:M17 family metallopeptidase [Spiroplasma clarkii]|uniref:M17 family metallopeptidase n=1 Tax=Spiroplasma clarkii TaxID=2139 RepID=UPI001649942B|nr:M17 family metallopeptidase [Spiroplasma clarkii]
MGLNLISAVGGSGKNPPVVLEVCFKNNPLENNFLVLVGKGVTFDSGGYALKNSTGIRTMRLDKSGAASLCGVLQYLVEQDVKVNVAAVLVLAENLIGQQALLPSQVITAYNQKTVQVDNPDAEGRLLLGEGISYLQDQYPCQTVISVATLTGAICTTLGKYMTGLFATDQKWAHNLKTACDAVGEEVWILPIHRQNYKQIRTATLADLTNAPESATHGASSLGAAFVAEFIQPQTSLLHFDIGGTGVEANRATGVLVRGIINFIKNYQLEGKW